MPPTRQIVDTQAALAATSSLRGRHFLKEVDFSTSEWLSLLDLAAALKVERQELGVNQPQRLRGQSIALIFEKSSTRTRCAFEVAAFEQGAATTYLDSQSSQIGHKESIADTARVLGRLYSGIEYRGFDQERVEALAALAGVPVFNGLTDQWHPTQMLADQQTMIEQSAKPLNQIKLAYLGDGRSNVGRSVLVAGALAGIQVAIVSPPELQPPAEVIEMAKTCRPSDSTSSSRQGQDLVVTDDLDAVAGADFLYTDIWVSMGESPDLFAERVRLLSPYQVNSELVARTGNDDVKVLHDLPALHDLNTEMARKMQAETGLLPFEISDEVFEANADVIFSQAENRMHAIKAVLVAALA